MSSITEQLSATSKSQLESQLNFLNNVLQKTVDGAQQVVALNLSTARNASERGAEAARQLIEARDARAVFELARPLSAIEGLFAYGRELFSIASRTQVELLQTARDRFGDVPAKTLVLAAPAVAQQPVADTAAAVTGAAQSAFAHTAQAGAQLSEQVNDQITDATEHATHTASTAVEAASDTIAHAAQAAQPAADAVTAAVEQVAQAVAENTPAASTAALFEGDGGAPKTVRSKPAAKPVAEAVAALADKPATTLKSAPGPKSRK